MTLHTDHSEFDDIVDRLRNIVNSHSNFAQEIRVHHKELLNTIMTLTTALDEEKTLQERIFFILNPDFDYICKHGKEKKFQHGNFTYVSCDKWCECAREKRKQTSVSKYGTPHPSQSDEVKNTIAETNLDRYGVKSTSQIPEIKNKQQQTLIANYGAEPWRNPKIIEKRKNTNFKKYGAPSSPAANEKRKKTMTELYGVEHALQNREIWQKSIDTMIDRYGDIPSRLDEFKEKAASTNIERYGVTHIMKDPKRFSEAHAYRKKKFILPSARVVNLQGYEPYVIDELLSHGIPEHDMIIDDYSKMPAIQYVFEEKERTFYPDIFIPRLNILIDVKSTFTYTYEKDKNIAKYTACKQLGYNFRFIIRANKSQLKILKPM